MTGSSFPQGAELTPSGVRYCVWAPQRKLAIKIYSQGELSQRVIPLFRDQLGYHHGSDARGRPGDRYLVRFGSGIAYPCPASRWQPEGIHGPSMVIDPGAFPWTDATWQRPAFRDLIIYEAHVGTFTPEGTFLAMIEKLPHLRELGVNALELMPIADFPGERNWGYDGVRLYAPARAYGHPDDLRALVDAAHAQGIAVLLDVVYNHFGPDGNYLGEFAPEYFADEAETPWGAAINFSHPEVRAYFSANLVYWMEEYHIDGFRLDATHAIYDASHEHILAEFSRVVHDRGGYLIAEDERNEGRLIAPHEEGGFGLDAVWADDFHHSVEVALIDASTYQGDFVGELHELVDALQHGWIYRGQVYPRFGRERGTPCAHLPPQRFVFCISNHDQAGNRALGERLNHLVCPETYRAASALLCLIPYTPLLFMGQEWGASTPFLYFTDHEEELGLLVEEGRQREIQRAPGQEKVSVLEKMISPQDPESFERSKLLWEELSGPDHQGCLRLYQEALRLRKAHRAFRPLDRASTQVAELACGILAIRATATDEDWLILCDLRGDHRGSLDDEPFCAAQSGQTWRVAFSSNHARFGGNDAQSYDEASGRLELTRPELLVLKAE